MRTVKLALISAVFLFVVVTIISFFFPSEVHISRAKQIDASADLVMQQIEEPLQWKTWYPGADSLSYYNEAGVTRGLLLNTNKQQALVIREKKQDEVLAEVINTNKKKFMMGWRVLAGDSFTTVQWHMDISLRWYPWEKFSSLLYDKIYGSEMERGLGNLKTVLEAGK